MEAGTTFEISDWDTGSDLRGYRCVPSDPVAAVLVVHGFGEHAGRALHFPRSRRRRNEHG